MGDDSTDTRNLVQRNRDGDRQALEELFTRHRERLRRMVQLRLDARLRARLDDSDVLQDILLEAARRLPAHLDSPQVPFFVWLRSIARQKLIDLYRRHFGAEARDARRELVLYREPLPGATSAVLAAQLLGDVTSPSEKVMQAELEFRLEAALDTMAPTDREVLILRHFEDLTHGEIAHELGISLSAAKKRYIRALRKLKELLEPGGNEEEDAAGTGTDS